MLKSGGAAGWATEETVSVIVVEWVMVPAVPVIVSVVVAAGVWLVVATFRVEVPVGVTVDGVKEPVAPAGKPVMLKDTAVLKPPTEVTVTVQVVDRPWLTVLLVGEADTVKSGEVGAAAEVIVNVAVVEWVVAPAVPVIVSVLVPAGVWLVVVIVRVEVPVGVTVEGLNVPVAPVGNPVTVKATPVLKPPTEPTVTV
jgi:hypothetical protein